jgi:dihydrofolate synthase/folylpolyglutamate synthase
VDIAIIETGLGGRLDSTNVIHPLLSVITNVGWDHMNLLGNTIEKIASEKAGIIKENVPVVLGERKREVVKIVKNVAGIKNAPLYIASDNYSASVRNVKPDALTITVRGKGIPAKTWTSDLTGLYQLKNIVTVLQSLEILKNKISIPERAIKKGLSSVRKNTGFAGRWHIIQRNPLIVADTGHNYDGIVQVLKMIRSIQYEKLHFVLGMVNDKALDDILDLLPGKAIYYFCKADIPRGLDPKVLKHAAAAFGLKGDIYSSVRMALKNAKKNAGDKDLIFVGGSTFTVAEVL